ncbi:MAG: hypothetical protein ACPGD5_01395 [Salibacteraceae bacterium]
MEINNVIVLKTDIQTERKLRLFCPILDNHSEIKSWSIDLEDCDKVLRIEAKPILKEQEIMHLMLKHGFSGEELKV